MVYSSPCACYSLPNTSYYSLHRLTATYSYQVITVLLAVCLTNAKPSTPLQGAPELSVAMLEKP